MRTLLTIGVRLGFVTLLIDLAFNADVHKPTRQVPAILTNGRSRPYYYREPDSQC